MKNYIVSFFILLCMCCNTMAINAQTNGQCHATTNKGTRCTNKALSNNYCTYHQAMDPNVKRCEATTKRGTQCKNAAQEGSKYCSTHQTNDPNVKKCKAKTRQGTRCKRAVVTDGYCTQHYKMKQQGKIN